MSAAQSSSPSISSSSSSASAKVPLVKFSKVRGQLVATKVRALNEVEYISLPHEFSQELLNALDAGFTFLTSTKPENGEYSFTLYFCPDVVLCEYPDLRTGRPTVTVPVTFTVTTGSYNTAIRTGEITCANVFRLGLVFTKFKFPRFEDAVEKGIFHNTCDMTVPASVLHLGEDTKGKVLIKNTPCIVIRQQRDQDWSPFSFSASCAPKEGSIVQFIAGKGKSYNRLRHIDPRDLYTAKESSESEGEDVDGFKRVGKLVVPKKEVSKQQPVAKTDEDGESSSDDEDDFLARAVSQRKK